MTTAKYYKLMVEPVTSDNNRLKACKQECNDNGKQIMVNG